MIALILWATVEFALSATEVGLGIKSLEQDQSPALAFAVAVFSFGSGLVLLALLVKKDD